MAGSNTGEEGAGEKETKRKKRREKREREKERKGIKKANMRGRTVQLG